jgi:hypothetical protein
MRCGLSAVDLSARTGLALGTIRAVERGHGVRVATVRKYVEALALAGELGVEIEPVEGDAR